jgi:tRNA A-37 threonylcarbamoyl transferase component Bud32
MIAVSNYRRYKAVFSFKSRAWQLAFTTLLLGLTYLLSLTSAVSMFEYDFFLYILELQPADRELVAIESIRLAPKWSLILVYGSMLAVYVHRYTRSRTTAVSMLTVILALFGLLMLEVMLAILLQLFLPVVFPALVMLIVSSIYWVAELYQGFVTRVLVPQESIALSDVRERIDKGDLRTALTMLKLCPYSDDSLEVGYELGLLLESGKHWASALNLYHWLSNYDPGLSDFVGRIEEIRNNRESLLELEKSKPAAETELPNIGYFRLLKKIARGSTAVMYEAIDIRSNNRVALKVMRVRPNEKVERDRVRHWLHEAEIVSQLDHDNIVKIHDAEMLGDNAYIAMDYIQGYSMSLRLRKREYLTVGECIRISKAMLRALVVAHNHGVIHGDIKPANIMYDSVNDTYILTDFGAAYSNHRERKAENIIVGTPAYMSPEQLESKKLDGRSDLFSLAVTLYHLLTGHQPFGGSSLPELKHNIVTNEPDLNHLTLPAGIAEVIIKALQKKPYMRFADAQQMLTSVEHCEKQLRERMHQHS